MKITITYPDSWAEVKLSQYLEYNRHIKPWIQSEEYAEKSVQSALLHFCKVPAEYINKLPKTVADKASIKLGELFTDINKKPLVTEFTVGDTVYGFIPSLDDMTYGEYLDLVAYTKKDLWDNILTVMAILYRPIKQRVGKLYTIEPYSGTQEARLELFKHVLTMDVVFGAISFFLGLQKDLLTGILTYSMEEMKKIKDPKVLAALQDLNVSGADITQLQSYLTKTLQDLTP
jgi:hypothetical protein